MQPPIFRPYEPCTTVAEDAICGLYYQNGRFWHCRRARLSDPYGTGARVVENPKITLGGYLTAEEKIRIAHEELRHTDEETGLVMGGCQ